MFFSSFLLRLLLRVLENIVAQSLRAKGQASVCRSSTNRVLSAATPIQPKHVNFRGEHCLAEVLLLAHTTVLVQELLLISSAHPHALLCSPHRGARQAHAVLQVGVCACSLRPVPAQHQSKFLLPHPHPPPFLQQLNP